MARKFNDLKTDLNQQFIEEGYAELNEGVYDPGIFKAFFLAGGPGSGKSFVVKKTTGGQGLKVVNSDDVFEKMLADAGMDATPDNIFSDKGQKIRGRAKEITKKRQTNFIQGRLGLIIDGTGKDFAKIQKQAAALKQLGYDCYMIFVNTSLDVAQERNLQRDRTLPADEVTQMWNGVQQNMGVFQRFFGNRNFLIVDNNVAKEDVFAKVSKRITKLVKEPVRNYVAKQWIANEIEKKRRR